MNSESALECVTIAPKDRTHLRKEFKRTKLTARRLLGRSDDVPDGLTHSHINRWMSGVLGQAFVDHFEYVANLLASLPDDAGRVGPDGQTLPKLGPRFKSDATRIPVTEEMSKLLRAELARTALDHWTLLDAIESYPEGLNRRIIRGWLYLHVKTTAQAYWDFVIDHLAQQPDFAGTLTVPIRKPRTLKQ